MSGKYTAVAINGSPHEGMGNTSQLVGMLKENLMREEFTVEEIFLNQHTIRYCAGCALCLEKGSCWIKDDYKEIAQKTLDADAVILASPVYVLNVTSQMKTFLDRSLGYGHRPRGSWKPGLAVSVSAGLGETWVSEYLASVLRLYGAFAVGRLTAIGIGRGEFLGKEAVEYRAADLARDLAQAVKGDRKFPPTDMDLRYWQFMGNLVKDHRDFMRADHEHWEKQGLYDSFEAYTGQTTSSAEVDPAMRTAWIQDLIRRQSEASKNVTPAGSDRESAQTARELLQNMPRALNSEAAQGVHAVYQFEVSGAEEFSACLEINDGSASYREGRNAQPHVTIRTPAEVWLSIAKGELDGAQAYMSGKYTAEGDLALLMKLKSFFSNR